MEILINFGDGNLGVIKQLLLLLVQAEREGVDAFVCFPSLFKVFAKIF